MKRILLSALLLFFWLGCLAQAKKSPALAAVSSALIPGGGQLYNHSYVKAGVFFSLESCLLGAALYHNNKADAFKDKLNSTTDAILQQEYRNKRKDHQDLRKRYFWLLGIGVAGSMLDAYVEAHLADFESEKSKLHLRFEGDALILELRY